jgi:tRNA nucleotidyltransferase (CCA-adding enzyme)
MMQDVLTGEIVDHFGGLDDIRASVLRHVNDDTFAEDPLRVLRAAQFAARFNFSVAEETVSLAKTMDLTALSWERIAGELQKALLKADAPSIFFREMRRMDQLSYWFPEMEQLIGLEQNPEYHPEGDVWTHTLMVIDEAAKLRKEADYPMGLMITAMVHDMGKAVCTTVDESGKIRSIGHENESELIESALSRITTEIRLKKYVHNMTQLHMRPVSLAKQTEKQKPYDKLFDQSVDPHDLLLFAKADYLGRKDVPDYTETEQLLQEKLRKFDELMSKPYVMGRDLVEMGLTPGPEFKELLEYAHTLRLAGVDKKAALSQTMALHRRMQND